MSHLVALNLQNEGFDGLIKKKKNASFKGDMLETPISHDYT